MEFVNQLPAAALAFRQFDQNGKLDCVVSVKATFRHVQDRFLELADEQEPFQWTDQYLGDPHRSPLVRLTDLTPDKPGTDVTYLGDTHAPGGRASKSWTAALQIGPISKSLAIFGKREWEPKVSISKKTILGKPKSATTLSWELSNSELARNVSMSWHLAFGGGVNGKPGSACGETDDVVLINPLGCGCISNFDAESAHPVPAPQIVVIEDEILNWRKKPVAGGFGPIPPWWPQRNRFAGTYDDNWLDTRHPLLPLDFDRRFWNCAPEDQVAIPYLKAGTQYRLINLHPQLPEARGFLPNVHLGVHCLTEDRDEWHLANLDGVHFDWRTDDRVLLTWRARFPLPEAEMAKITLDSVAIATEEAA
jgi:hypothetical protein